MRPQRVRNAPLRSQSRKTRINVRRQVVAILVVIGSDRRSLRVLLCGMETPPTRGFDYSLAFHAVFPDLGRRHSVPLVPFLLAGVALVPELNGPDGVHPNAAGALRIADTVWPYLEPLLAATTTRLEVVGVHVAVRT